jgi:hypothetical protein
MSDYSDSKKSIAGIYPEGVEDSARQRLEPLIGAQLLRSRHLFGAQLVPRLPDPVTGKRIPMTDEQIQDIIDGAVEQAEIDCRIDIFPTQIKEKLPFDKNHYEAFGYMQTKRRPIASVERIAVTPANGLDVYVLPKEWLEMAYCVRGQLNIIPMTAAFIQGGFVPTQSTGSAFFLSILGNRQWIPAYWQIDYTTGYPNGQVPRIINELVGTVAAMEILSMLATGFLVASHSLSMDGLGQSVSTPGPQVYKQRLDDLDSKRTKLIKRIRNRYGQGIFSSHV